MCFCYSYVILNELSIIGCEMKFGEKVKIVRQKLLLSQEDLAKELGISFATVNRWETGRTEPNFIKQRLFNDFCKQHNIDEENL